MEKKLLTGLISLILLLNFVQVDLGFAKIFLLNFNITNKEREMNYIKIFIISLFLMVSFNSNASDTSDQNTKTEEKVSIEDFYEAQIILNNIESLIKGVRVIDYKFS